MTVIYYRLLTHSGYTTRLKSKVDKKFICSPASHKNVLSKFNLGLVFSELLINEILQNINELLCCNLYRKIRKNVKYFVEKAFVMHHIKDTLIQSQFHHLTYSKDQMKCC